MNDKIRKLLKNCPILNVQGCITLIIKTKIAGLHNIFIIMLRNKIYIN